MYKFNTKAQYWLDTEEFEQRFAELKGMTLSQAVGQVKKYQECLNLYQGEYLPEELHADWVVPVRNYYRRIYLETFADYIKILNVLNDLPAIGAACEQALLVEPLEEAVHIHSAAGSPRPSYCLSLFPMKRLCKRSRSGLQNSMQAAAG